MRHGGTGREWWVFMPTIPALVVAALLPACASPGRASEGAPPAAIAEASPPCIAAGRSGAAMRPAGAHTFCFATAAGPVRWTVDREDWPAGALEVVAPSVTRGIATADGPRATLALPHVAGRETRYHIRATDGRRVDSTTVQVFPAGGVAPYVYRDPRHPPLRVWVTVPPTVGSGTRLLVVMHGASRNASSYAASWAAWAARTGYVVLTPEFDKARWPGAAEYNLGNVFTGASRDGVPRPEADWTFAHLDAMRAHAQHGLALPDSTYDLWGHSAGAQFVHRFLLWRPASPVRRAVAANAGWYTVPDTMVALPYGLAHPALRGLSASIRAWTQRPVVLMRGTADTVRGADFRVTPEADAQGPSRYARAGYMLARVQAADPATRWSLEDVPGAAHSQRQMAPAAQALFARARAGAP